MDALDRVTTVLAVRHGETAWNRETRIQGQLDIPLNALGRAQAQRLAQALADQPIDVIYASDLGRAGETARIVASRLGLDVRSDPGLRERAFGVFEGRTWAEIEERWPAESERWRRRDPEFGAEGGERLQDFYARAVAAAQRLAAGHPGQNVLLVAHGGVLDCLYRAAARQPLQAPRTWLLGNATINRLLYTGQDFNLVGWNDDKHLDGLSLDEAAA
jgi:probable phosphoglycerate mutase